MTGLWFSPGTLVSSTNKTDHHDIADILLKVALNTIKSNQSIILNVRLVVDLFSYLKYKKKNKKIMNKCLFYGPHCMTFILNDL
jgi:hypothetical protein